MKSSLDISRILGDISSLSHSIVFLYIFALYSYFLYNYALYQCIVFGTMRSVGYTFSFLPWLWPPFIPQFSSVAQSCLTPCDTMDCSTPGLPVHHQLLVLTQTHVHWVSDATQPSHPLASPSLPIFNLHQHQGLFKWVCSLHQVAKVLEFQL